MMDDEFEIIMAKRIPSQPRFRWNYDFKKKVWYNSAVRLNVSFEKNGKAASIYLKVLDRNVNESDMSS